MDNIALNAKREMQLLKFALTIFVKTLPLSAGKNNAKNAKKIINLVL